MLSQSALLLSTGTTTTTTTTATATVRSASSSVMIRSSWTSAPLHLRRGTFLGTRTLPPIPSTPGGVGRDVPGRYNLVVPPFPSTILPRRFRTGIPLAPMPPAPSPAAFNGVGVGVVRLGLGSRVGGCGGAIACRRRNYIVLPSKLSELSRFLWDGIKFYTGLFSETGRRTSRRLVLRLRDRTTTTHQRTVDESAGTNGVGAAVSESGRLAMIPSSSRRRATIRLRSRLRDHRTRVGQHLRDHRARVGQHLRDHRARVGQHLRNATNRWRSRVQQGVLTGRNDIGGGEAAAGVDAAPLSSRLRGTGRIAVLRATRMVHRARRRAARARARLSVSSSSSSASSLDSGAILRPATSGKEEQSSSSSSWRWRRYAITLPDAGSSSNFDSDGYPLVSRDAVTGRYINPWCDVACRHRPLSDLFRWRFGHRFFEARDLVPSSASEFWRRTGVFFAGRRRGAAAAASLPSSTTTTTTTTERVRAAIEAYERQRASSEETVSVAAVPDPSGRASAHLLPSADESDAPAPALTGGEEDRVKLTWIGHSTCLVQMHGFAILTDPVFSHRIGPLAPLAGVDRFVPPSHTIDEIGSELLGDYSGGILDAVLISHDHYDHLDYTSIHDLVTSEDVRVDRWFVPLGTKRWLLDRFGDSEPYSYGPHIDEDDVHEMAWWDSAEFFRRTEATADDHDVDDGASEGMKMTVHCAPAQHWCSRTPFDRNSRLWCSWAVRTGPVGVDADEREGRSGMDEGVECDRGSLSFYYAGDTGLPPTPSSSADGDSSSPSSSSMTPPSTASAAFPLHRQIGDRLGPFDLSALPIGAYQPSFYMSDSHMDPEEARRVHCTLRSRRSVAVHWGTFPLADEPFYEPPARLREAEESGAGAGMGTGAGDGSDGEGMFGGGMAAPDVDGGGLHDDDSFVVIRQGDSIESEPRHGTTATAAGTMDGNATVNVAEGGSIGGASSRGSTVDGVAATSRSEDGGAPNSSSSSPVKIVRKKKKRFAA